MITANTNGMSRLGTLMLGWLLTREGEEETQSALRGALDTVLALAWSDPEKRHIFDREIVVLEQAKYIEFPRSGRLRLIRRGRGALRAALGVKSLPEKSDWRSIKKTCLADAPLPPKQVSSKRGKSTDREDAANIARYHGLKLGNAPTLRQVRDALAWKAIDVETTEPFTLAAVLKVLLNRVLKTTKPLEVSAVLKQLAAEAAEANRDDTEESPQIRLRRWLASPAGPVEPPDVEDDNTFAARVMAAARASETGRFGDNKVYISHVFRRLVDEGAVVKDLDAFKARLVSAHTSGLLALSRADMVEAMKPEDLDASATMHSGATFHFVRIQ